MKKNSRSGKSGNFIFSLGYLEKMKKKTWKSQGISKMFLNINCFCKQHSCFNIYGLRFFLKIKSASIDIFSKSLNCRWMTIAKIGLPKGFGKRSKVREKSVKSQGILKRILSGNPVLWLQRKNTFTHKNVICLMHLLHLVANITDLIHYAVNLS